MRFQELLDASPDAVLVLDDRGTIRAANAHAESVLGYAPTELVSRPVAALLDPPGPLDDDGSVPSWDAYLEDPVARPLSHRLELSARREDGTEVPVRASLGPIVRDTETYVVATLVDVSSERDRESELYRRTETLESLLEATQQLLKTTENEMAAHTAVDYVDDVLGHPFAAIWLYDADRDLLDPTAWTEAADDLFETHPTYTGDGKNLSWEAFETGEPRYVPDTHEEPERYNPDTPIRCDLILPLGRYGVLNIGALEPDAFDDTDRTIARIWASTVTMVFVRIERERQLRDREATVTRERDRLEEFANIVSHDLRNPLNVAVGNLQLARERRDDEELATVRRALDRMDALIGDMLTLARQGATVDEPEAVALDALVEECWATVDGASADPDADRSTVVADAGVTVLADRSRLAQLLENLFRNSVEHGSTGGRTASCDSAERDDGVRIEVGRLPDGFYVADDGPGIDPERREEVFEAGVTTNPEGTGFGLKIVAEVADAHGWSVAVRDAEGGGARFEFTGVELVD